MIISEIDWFNIGISAGSFVAGIITIFLPKIKHFISRNKKEPIVDKISDSIDMHLKMQELITELRAEFDSSRAFLYIFHNGGYFLDGSSMKKVSCIYESVKKGVSYEAADGQSVPVSVLPLIIQNVSTEPAFFVVDNMPDSFDKHYLEKRNVYASAYAAIKRSAQIIGFVGIHYCNGDTKTYERYKDKDGIFELLQHTADCASIELMKMREQK